MPKVALEAYRAFLHRRGCAQAMRPAREQTRARTDGFERTDAAFGPAVDTPAGLWASGAFSPAAVRK